jgi:tripartite-type tricarboxylate transporter receptor subunit TctC
MSIYKFIATFLFLIYLGLLFFLYKGGNSNEAYPNKPITIVVHSKPGSSVDLMSRKVAELARKYCKEPFVIENHPGTQGIVAMQYVMDRKPDGYMMLGVTKSFLSTLIVNKSDVVISDFLFLANMISDPEAVITNKKSGIQSVENLVTQARELNGKQVWIGPGTGSRDYLMAMKSWETLNIKAEWVDYKSGPQSVLAMLRNEAPVYVGNPSDIIGKDDLRIIAIAANSRLESLPEVPTFKEYGYDINESMWRGFAVKKGTPPQTVQYLSEVLKKVSQDPEWIDYCKEVNSFPDFLNTKIFSEKIDNEMTETIDYLKKAGLLNSYVKKGPIPLLMMAVMLALFVIFVLFLLIGFNVKKFTYNLFLSGLFIWVALFYYYQTLLFDIPEGLNITSPALIPQLWAILLFIVSIWNLVNELKGKNKRIRNGRIKLVGKILLALLIYFIAIPQIGYFLSTPFFLLAGFYILKYRKIPVMITYSFGFVLFSYVVFQMLLKIDLPLGNLFL